MDPPFINARHWLIFSALLYVSVCLSLPVPGEAYKDVTREGPDAEQDPTRIATEPLSCFDDKYIYERCGDPYRLDIQGSINVPPDYTDEFCSGPCLTETRHVLNCLEHIVPDFQFYNKATIKDVRVTLKAACGHGSDRGNFDVAEHIGSEESDAARANSVVLGIVFLILLRKLLFF